MDWKKATSDYLTFSRKERIGIIAIILVILFIWISPKLLRNSKPKEFTIDSSWVKASQEVQSKSSRNKNQENENENANAFVFEKTIDSKTSKFELFYFDPNRTSEEDWKKLGLSEKTIHTIQNYLSKGGHFYKTTDLQKIYGFKSEDFERLEPYIKIEGVTDKDDIKNAKKELKESGLTSTPYSTLKFRTIDINTADTTAFISLPGIGSKLAARIVNFRDKLGGFYSLDQVGETYGLPDSTFQKIKNTLVLSSPSVKKLNINTATKDEMKVHPYFKWALANAIVEYRNQHGNFSTIEELKKISLITDDVFNKIKNYLTL